MTDQSASSLARKSGTMEARSRSLTAYLGHARVDAARRANLYQTYGVTGLSLFGSAVRGELGPDSDVEVMVEFDPAVGVGILKFESLVEGLRPSAGRKIDLVAKRGLKPGVRQEA